MICIDCGQDIYNGEEQCEDCKNNSAGNGMSQNVLLHSLASNDPVCIMCNTSCRVDNSRSCTNCTKYVHIYCESSDVSTLDVYLCIVCRQRSLVGNVMLNTINNDPVSPLNENLNASQLHLNEMMSVPRPTASMHQSDFDQLYQPHHSHIPTQSHIKEEFSDNTTNDSAQNSPFYTESSDYDEDFVPGSSRGRGRGGGAKKKPGRGSSLLKKQPVFPQTGFYSAAQLQALTQPTSTRGKRGKRGINKAPGKGGGRGRGRGRGSANALQQQQLQIQQQHQNTIQALHSPQLQIPPMQHPSYPMMHQQMSYPTNSFQQVAPPSTIREVDESLVVDETSRQSAATRADDAEYIRTIVVCSSDDIFMKKACLCLVCGAVGRGLESSMVACSNCAQTYHTYCVGLHDKLNSTVMYRGWRCLDCTVCEGCGKGGDESKLLLCEECDVSYHIYCLRPPLDRIPTGQWRCQWCARCRRCNIKVTNQTELTKEGLCLPCHSLKRCNRCAKGYSVGDKIIRCSQCNKWQHGQCENLFNDEMLEQAAINRMRCSSCRPNKSNSNLGFGDGSDVVFCDNVALSKNADEVLKSKFMPSLVRPAPLESYGYRDSFDHYGGEEEYNPTEEVESFVAQRGRGRGNPGGRRGTNRIGIGGFYAKLPRHRVLALTEEANAMNNLDEEDLKKMKRPRKPRRSQLEDAYPPAIQEAFFGIKAVEGKALVDISVEEPALAEYGNGKIGQSDGAGHELSSVATEMLINDIAENNFLENVDLGDIDGDLENVDLSFFGDGCDFDDDFEDSLGGLEMDMKNEIDLDDINVKPLDATTFPMDQASSSSAYSNFGGQQSQSSSMPVQNPMYPNEANNYAPTTGHTLSRSSSTNNADPPERYQFSERWEEDEPLGLQATTAAVLYANEKHSHLKERYPEWPDRVKQIQRLWRTLSADERQEYVNRARENRTNRGRNPRPRRNIAHSNSVDSPTVQSPAPHQMGRSDGFKVPAVPGGNGTPFYDQEPVVPLPVQPQPVKQYRITCHLVQEVFMQYRQIKEKQVDLEKIVTSMEGDLSKQRKQKKNLAAKKRQMMKTAQSAPDYDGRIIDLNDADKIILAQLTESIKSLQGDLENSKRDMKTHETSVREFEIKNMILRNENEVTQQMMDQTQMMNQQATVQDNARMMMMRQQQMLQMQQQQQLQQQQPQHHLQPQQRMQVMPVTGQPQMGQMQQMQQMPPGAQMGQMHAMRGPPGQQMPGQPQFGPQGVMMQRPPGPPGPPGVPMGPQPGMVAGPSGIPGGPHGMPNGPHGPHGIPNGPHGMQVVPQGMQGGPQGMPNGPQGMPGQPMTIQQHNEMRRIQVQQAQQAQQAQRRARAPAMGGVRLDQIEDPVQREVYECLDDVLMHISMCIDGPNERVNHMLKRLLDPSTGAAAPVPQQQMPIHAHSQPGPSGPPPAPVDIDPPKPKKKRTVQKKTTQSFPTGTEYDLWIEKMRTRFRLCPEIPKRAKEPPLNGLRANFAVQGIADFLILPNRRFLVGNELGKMNLAFVDDFFTGEDRTSRTLSHKYMSMQDIAPAANLAMLYSQTTPSDEEYIYDEWDLKSPTYHPLSILCGWLNRRRGVPLEHIRSQSRSAPTQGPIEPLRRMFYVETKEEEVEVEMVLQPEAPHLSGTGEKIGEGGVDEIKHRLTEILKMERDAVLKIEDTPPMSPSLSPLQERIETTVEREIKMEVEEECETPPTVTTPMLREIKKEITSILHKCQKCSKIVDPVSGVRQKMGKLGILPNESSEAEKEETAYFCSIKCYYELMATSKVPLSHDEVNSAESVVDEDTYNQLKQIHSDNIVKAVSQGKAKLPCAPSVSMMEGLISPKDTRYMMDEGRRELITMIPVSALSTSTEKAPEPPRVPTEEWKSYSEDTVESFAKMIRTHQEYISSAKMGVPVPEHGLDERPCVLCGSRGDGDTSMCGRLLALAENFWVHVNCALWSSEVYESSTGGLINVDLAVVRARTVNCVHCGYAGASIKCHKLNCPNEYHVMCALRTQGFFIKDRTFICRSHGPVSVEVTVQRLDALRRIYIHRCENDLLKRMFELADGPKLCLRLGAFSFYNVGQILPDQLKSFHNNNFIFPNGYKINRWFWSPKGLKERILFECSISDKDNKPLFNVKAIDDPEICYSGDTPTAAWSPIFEQVLQLRGAGDMLKFFSSYVHGETLFGLNEGVVSKITESLPGVDQLFTYNFRHQNSPLLDLPLAENPMGCARAEPRFRTLIKHHRVKPAATSSSTAGGSDGPRSSNSTSSTAGRTRGHRPSYMDEAAAAQIKAMGLSAEYTAVFMRNLEPTQSASQTFSAYQKMRREWKNTVYLARSKIQGLGLYAKHDITMGDFIIEYKGEVIRSEVGEVREKRYNSQNRGVYMFRIDEEWIIDATMAGGPARYINHSCDPNCSTRIHDPGSGPADKKIIITANRPIRPDEELTYDYQFELEDSTDKIPCLCGAPNCVKWMN